MILDVSGSGTESGHSYPTNNSWELIFEPVPIARKKPRARSKPDLEVLVAADEKLSPGKIIVFSDFSHKLMGAAAVMFVSSFASGVGSHIRYNQYLSLASALLLTVAFILTLLWINRVERERKTKTDRFTRPMGN